MRLRDKVILVTGSTTGIGEAMARRFVEEGARVQVHGRDQQRGEEVASSLGDAAGLTIGDLADPAVPPRIVQETLSKWGRLDGIVNNAASVARSNLSSTDAANFDLMMAINVRAPLLIIKAAVDELAKQRGAILNIGSINSYCGEANLLDYSISKGGLLTMSRNLADAFIYKQIRVNHFNVGWVLTENEYRVKIADGLSEDWPEHIPPELAPAGRLIKPEEIAAAAVYWLSDESYPISGSVVDMEQYPVVGRNPTKQEDDE